MILNEQQYQKLYEESLIHPELFWASQAKEHVSWIQPWDSVLKGSFEEANITWFEGGVLNVCYNCIDRHLKTRANEMALIWEGNEPHEVKKFSYSMLHHEICRFANVLKHYGIKKGERVCIYLPMIPEAIIAMLACARIGAIHTVVFAGFSAESLEDRILDAQCSLVITADELFRGEKIVPLKTNVDTALMDCPHVQQVIVVKRTGADIAWSEHRDIWYHEAIQKVDADCPIEPMQATSPLFILYTSGSTGKPKGVVHSTGGYLVYIAVTFHYIFKHLSFPIHWCTADIGWITGHSYAVYGPLSQGATTVIFEGVPHYPNYARYWEIIDKHQVHTFYTAPTAIRTLRHAGDNWLKTSTRDSLTLLGTVGEPINDEVWRWYHSMVGNNRCPIVDTWWQTETGGILITPFHKVAPLIPGVAGKPFFGIQADIVDEQGKSTNNTGRLVIRKPWPGLMQTIYNDHTRFVHTYLREIPGCYYTGDGATRDEQGNYKITGRIDDVIKVSGHRIGTEEIESALVKHPAVSEAAAIGIPDDITGEMICAFVLTKAQVSRNDALKKKLIEHVRTHIGPIAKPGKIYWVDALPKTRSGKILRRILRKLACHESDLGDLSTLADQDVLKKIQLTE